VIPSKGYVADRARASLRPLEFERRPPRPSEVLLDILYCGICHSDVAMVDDDWGFGLFPMVPGHEIIGRVSACGAEVTKFRAGDIAAVGCLSDSCRECPHCRVGLEQYCDNVSTPSFSTYERGTTKPLFGGFSTSYVVDQRFALKVPRSLDAAAAAPLLCAGITTYSPLRHWRVGPGDRVAIAGLGGLGHLAVKFARAMGAEVSVITSSPGKRDDALRLGASEVLISSDPARMAAAAGSFSFLLDTISASHSVEALLRLVRTDGTLCIVGVPAAPIAFPSMALAAGRKSISGSGMGGLPETQEMLDFCGEHGISADIELLPAYRVNEAFDRLKKHDVRYRFVLDMRDLSP
jgi:uncharacterized zinc-type alcohol dehydrogenase-like protein